MTEVVLREVREDDLAVLCALDVEHASRMGRPPPDEDKCRAAWFGSQGPFERRRVVAQIEDEIVGAGRLMLIHDSVSVTGHTSGTSRGRGVGTALVEWGITSARDAGAKHVSVSGYLEDDACALLEANGFSLSEAQQWTMEAQAVAVDAPTFELEEMGSDPLSDTYLRLQRSIFGTEFELGTKEIVAPDFEDFCLYASANGEAIGFCHCMLRRSTLEGSIMFLGVEEAHRHRGLGRRLLRAGGNELIRRGAGKLWLSVDTTNEHALDLYKSEGYELRSVVRIYGLTLS